MGSIVVAILACSGDLPAIWRGTVQVQMARSSPAAITSARAQAEASAISDLGD
jgi:hypothetical protein